MVVRSISRARRVLTRHLELLSRRLGRALSISVGWDCDARRALDLSRNAALDSTVTGGVRGYPTSRARDLVLLCMERAVRSRVRYTSVWHFADLVARSVDAFGSGRRLVCAAGELSCMTSERERGRGSSARGGRRV